MEARLPAHLWVSAFIKRANGAGKPAMLVQRGDEHGGTIFIRIDFLDGTATVLSPSFALSGKKIWLRATGTEPISWADSNAYIERQKQRDPDFWLIDIEAPDGDPLLEEPIDG